jgi:hypothetical protein
VHGGLQFFRVLVARWMSGDIIGKSSVGKYPGNPDLSPA